MGASIPSEISPFSAMIAAKKSLNEAPHGKRHFSLQSCNGRIYARVMRGARLRLVLIADTARTTGA